MKNKNIAIIHKEPSYYAEYQNEYSAGNYFLSYFISPNMSVSIQKDTDNSNVNFSYYIFHSASSRYPEEACNFDNFLTLYESISFIMSAVLGTTADCIFSIKILFLKVLISLHDLRKIMQDAMLHTLFDAFRLLKFARCRFKHKYLHSSNYCFGGQYFKKNGGRK